MLGGLSTCFVRVQNSGKSCFACCWYSDRKITCAHPPSPPLSMSRGIHLSLLGWPQRGCVAWQHRSKSTTITASPQPYTIVMFGWRLQYSPRAQHRWLWLDKEADSKEGNMHKGKANTWKNSTDSTAMTCNNNCHLQSPTIRENVWYRVCSPTWQGIMEGCMCWMEMPHNAKGHICD
jgi:hypothetical protein